MRACLQRVSRASVTVAGEIVGAIERGLVVLLGVAVGDTDQDLETMVEKIRTLRIFDDADGKMNLSVADVGGAVLLISQFTLLGDARKGRRPGFIDAAPPEIANAFYERAVASLRTGGLLVETGRFRTHMEVSLVNDGPVTILLDSRKTF
ncbi:MAG: D-aminoacyl-tRNA deacylase [Pirellulales bacterium]